MNGASRQALPLKEIGAINQMFCLIQRLTEVISRLLQLSYILDFPAIKGYGPQSSHVIIVVRVGIPWLTVSAFLDHVTRFGAVLLRAFSVQHSGRPAEVRSSRTLHLRLPWSLLLVVSIRWSDPGVSSAGPCSTATMCFHDCCLSFEF